MKVGLNLLLWTASATEEHLPLLEQIKDWGFDGVEMPMMAGAQGTPWKQFAKTLGDLGLGCTGVTCLGESADPTGADPAVGAAAVDHLKGCVDACVQLGAESVNGPVHATLGKLTGKPRTEDEWKHSVDTLRAVGEYANQAGVDLGVEFLNRFETYFLNTAADASRYVDEIGLPNVGVQYDTFHANIEEKNVTEAITTAGARIRHVHTCENDRSVPGRGQVPWDETFAALKQVGYDRWPQIEAFGSAIPELAAAALHWRDLFGTPEELAREGCAFLRDKWASA